MRRLLPLALTLALAGCGASDSQPEEPSQSPQMQDEEDEIQLSEPAPADPPSAEGAACETDEDCVPATCCHPTECVARADAPDCSATMCTMDCQGNTLDCGGSCLCRGGRCAAQFAPAR